MRAVMAMIALGTVSPALAQAAATDCTAIAVPPAFAGWARPRPLAASAAAGQAPTIAVGAATRLALHPAATLRFAAPPQKAGDAASHGGLASFTVSRAGAYQVALGAGAWVDVIRDSKALASTAHGHGPTCSGIRKIVDFRLQPGRYLLQLAGSADPALTAMIVARR